MLVLVTETVYTFESLPLFLYYCLGMLSYLILVKYYLKKETKDKNIEILQNNNLICHSNYVNVLLMFHQGY